MTSWKCGTELDHAIAAVGYNKNNGDLPYLIIRNSWGPDWGDGGYIKLGSATGKGICGVN